MHSRAEAVTERAAGDLDAHVELAVVGRERHVLAAVDVLEIPTLRAVLLQWHATMIAPVPPSSVEANGYSSQLQYS